MSFPETHCRSCGGKLEYLLVRRMCLACGAQARPHIGVQLGQQLPGYRLLEPRGEGSFHEVWKGHCLSTGQAVTVRLPRAVAPVVPDVWRSVEHPQLARLREMVPVQHEGETLVAEIWDWAPGLTLRQYLNLTRSCADDGVHLYMADLRELITALFGGLKYLHARQVAHGDVRAENILVEQTLRAAPTVGLYRAHYQRVPRLIDPQANASPRRDQLLMGIVVFELLTGQFPVVGCAWPEELYPFLGKGVDDVVKRALGAEGRPAFAGIAEMEAALDAAFERGTGYDFNLFGTTPGYERFFARADYYS